MSRVLLVEEDPDLAEIVRRLLTRAGHSVVHTNDGRTALRDAYTERPDLVILDMTLPGMDGWQVLERLRDVSDVPVLLLIAFGLELDRPRGLRGAADGYLPKPFRGTELLAQVEALLRRSPAPAIWADDVYDDGVLRVDLAARRASVGGEEVALTPTEYRLLTALVRHAGALMSPNQLLAQVWDDPTGIGMERVRYAVLRLRRKLGWDDPATSPIESVGSMGFRYRRPDSGSGSGRMLVHAGPSGVSAASAGGGASPTDRNVPAADEVVASAAAIVAQAAALASTEMGVDMYLDTDDEAVAGRVFRAVDAIAALLGLVPTSEEIQRGSFFRRLRAMLRRGMTAEEVTSRLAKVERAIELVHLDARQAEVDQKEASAVAELFNSLADVPQACLRIGSIFIVKYTDANGPVVLSRNLSQLELRALERYPEIQRDPRRAIDSLATAMSTLERNVEGATGPSQGSG